MGAILGGDLKGVSGDYSFKPGILASVSSSWRLLRSDGLVPFVDLTGSAAVSWSRTEMSNLDPENYIGSDLRLGARAGWNIGQVVYPYVFTRAFGGPVSWTEDGEAVQGTDIYHFQVGAGLSVYFQGFGLYFEASPLGEQNYSGGLSVTF